MQLTRRLALLVAPALLIPLTIAANTPSVLQEVQEEARQPWRIDLRLGYFQQEDSGGIPQVDENGSAFQGLILVDAPIGSRDRLSLKVMTDVVSSASITRAHNPSYRALQSEASGVVHVSGSLGWSHRFDALTLSASAGGSADYAYNGISGSLGVSVPLFGGASTLRLSTSGNFDTVAMIRFDGRDENDETRWTLATELGWTQILTSTTLLDLSVTHIAQGGFLAGQFNSVFVNGIEQAEMLPGDRQRTSVTARVKQAIGEQHAIEVGGRYYRDDWGIQAGTANLEYAVWLDAGKRFLLRPGYRLHVQGAADAYAPSFTAESLGTGHTSDPDLGDFTGHTGSLGFTMRHIFGDGTGDIDLSASLSTRSNGLQMAWGSLGYRIEF